MFNLLDNALNLEYYPQKEKPIFFQFLKSVLKALNITIFLILSI